MKEVESSKLLKDYFNFLFFADGEGENGYIEKPTYLEIDFYIKRTAPNKLSAIEKVPYKGFLREDTPIPCPSHEATVKVHLFIGENLYFELESYKIKNNQITPRELFEAAISLHGGNAATNSDNFYKEIEIEFKNNPIKYKVEKVGENYIVRKASDGKLIKNGSPMWRKVINKLELEN